MTRPAVGTQAGVQSWAQSNLLARSSLLATLLLATWLGMWPLLATPAALPVDAPAGSFSAGRALQDLAVVAAQPHPIGSPRNAAVRDYLVAQIEALGLTPEIQRATLTRARPERGMTTITAVENILVRVPGTDSSGAIVVTGHYDSVPTSGGAADCGSCVVTVLETLRVLQSGPALKNDVIFLFADGEEVGVTGARGFVMDHPWAQDVAFYMVFEGYGTGGASMLYVASPQSGELVASALGASTMPTGYSFLHDIMWALAGNTGSDLDAVVAAGKPGLAFINLSVGGAPAYHVMADAPAYLNPGSLQHHGENAVGILRQLGNADLPAIESAADAVYFNILPGVVVTYPGALALPFAGLAALLYIAVLVMALRRRAATLGGIILGALALLVSLVAATVAVTLAWWLLRLANPNWHIVLLGGWYGAPWYFAGFVALALAVTAGCFLLLRRWFSLGGLALGALAWWSVLALLTARSLTGFSPLFTWPLLAMLLAAAWALWQPAAAQRPWPRTAALALAGIVTLVLAAPVVYVLAVYAGRMEAIMGQPAAALPIPVAVLAFGLLLPQIDFLAFGVSHKDAKGTKGHEENRKEGARGEGRVAKGWVVPVAALAVGALCLGVAVLQSGFSAEHPKTNTVVYELNADTGAARWVTVNDSLNGRGTRAQLDAWTGQFFPLGGEEIEYNPWLAGWFVMARPALAAAAPVAPYTSSAITVLAEDSDGGARHVRLGIMPAEGVLNSQIIVENPGALRSLVVDGVPYDLAANGAPGIQVVVSSWPAAGITLEATLAGGEPLRLTVQDRHLGLPSFAELPITPRPDWMAPAPLGDLADSAIVRGSFVVE